MAEKVLNGTALIRTTKRRWGNAPGLVMDRVRAKRARITAKRIMVPHGGGSGSYDRVTGRDVGANYRTGYVHRAFGYLIDGGELVIVNPKDEE